MIDLGRLNIEQVSEIIQNIDSKSNSDLTKVMDFLREDFDETKDLIIDLTKHLDNIEKMYDLIHKEFKRRTNG
jgi:uncharacterized membrane protein YgaE (UPF0421/DUF939 family)